MKWFTAKTIEELKKEYKKLATQYHPDICGDDVAMKEINAEYDVLFEQLKNVHQTADGKTYESKTDSGETPEEFRAVIDALIKFNGINIELIGSWIWVTGNTYPNRKALKELKFRFSKSKTAWYFHTTEYRKSSNKTFTLNEIRDLYGSQSFQSEPQLRFEIK